MPDYPDIVGKTLNDVLMKNSISQIGQKGDSRCVDRPEQRTVLGCHCLALSNSATNSKKSTMCHNVLLRMVVFDTVQLFCVFLFWQLLDPPVCLLCKTVCFCLGTSKAEAGAINLGWPPATNLATCFQTVRHCHYPSPSRALETWFGASGQRELNRVKLRSQKKVPRRDST